jgi:hypothetical protein
MGRLAGPTRAEELMKRACGLTPLLALSLILVPACLQHDPDDDLALDADATRGPTRRAPRVAPAPSTGAVAVLVERRGASAADARFAEDGAGGRVPATDPVVFEVRGPIVARGMDQVLHVGDRVFRQGRPDGRGLIRFVAADAALVPESAPVELRYTGVSQ